MIDFPEKRVVLTGASGFIGRHLLARLRQLGLTVVAASRREGFDLLTSELMLDEADHVIHLAGRTGVVQAWQEPLEFVSTNTLGTARVVEQCRRTGCSMTMVSAYTYGLPARLPIKETDPIRPNNPYALSKGLAEQICMFYTNYFDIAVVILRLFNVYGPHQSTSFIIPHIVAQVVDPSCTEVVVEDLSPRRDYVFITDVLNAIVATIGSGLGGVFNVGSGRSLSVEEIIQATAAVAGIDKPYRALGRSRTNDIEDVVADISAIKREIGWRPRVSIEQGLRVVIDSMLNGKLT